MTSAGDGAALALTDLLIPFGRLNELMRAQTKRQGWLDAYLFCAAAAQCVEDELHPDRWSLARWASYLSHGRGTAAAFAAGEGQAIATAVARLGERLPSACRLRPYRDACVELAEQLAGAVLDPDSITPSQAAVLARRAARVAAGGRRMPDQMQGRILRLPACFRSFDQRPEDMDVLAGLFRERWPDRQRPLVVAGVRTSGSYLGPLVVAALRRAGYRDVQSLSVRPGSFLHREERSRLRTLGRRAGLVLLVDDPPVTGTSVAAAASILEEAGLPSDAVVLLLCLVEPASPLPAQLRRYASISLGWPDWHVHEQLKPDAVRQTLDGLLPSHLDIIDLLPVALTDAATARGHCRARFVVRLADRIMDRHDTRQVVVEGAGLGWLGRHAVATAAALAGHVPEAFGFSGGLLYRTWSASSAVTREHLGELAPAVVEYVAARRELLAATADHSVELGGCQPVWEVAAAELSRALGRAGLPLRTAVVEPMVRQLLRVDKPSVIDGRMDLDHWIRRSAGRAPIKVGFSEGAFSHRELSCYDAVFDLAGAAVTAGDDGFGTELRQRYQIRIGRTIDEERWLLYQLVHLWDARRRGTLDTHSAGDAAARAMQRYFAAVYLSDLDVDPSGRCCAIDLDGVLEISPLGWPATTGAGALALRALIAHRYRPLLATGRSLDELRDRCHTYSLPGGVAEYGAVAYLTAERAVIELCSPSDRDVGERLRRHLGELPAIRVDPAYRRIVRASRDDGQGRQRGLTPALSRQALAVTGSGDRMVAIEGEGQTDFVPAGRTKAAGLAALLERLGTKPSARRPLALAVGDGPADLPMFELAELALAPANAAPPVRHSRASVVKASYQEGLSAAASRLLAHRPGSCPVCRLPPLDAGTRQLIALLSVQEAGGRGMPTRLAALARMALSSADQG